MRECKLFVRKRDLKSHSCINELKEKNEEKDQVVSDQRSKIERLEK